MVLVQSWCLRSSLVITVSGSVLDWWYQITSISSWKNPSYKTSTSSLQLWPSCYVSETELGCTNVPQILVVQSNEQPINRWRRSEWLELFLFIIINTASVHHNLLLADFRLLTVHVNLFVQIIRLQIHHDSKRPGNVGPAYLSRETELRKWHTHTLPPPRPPKNVLRSSAGIHPRSKPYLAFLHPALQKVLFLQLVPFQVGGKCIFEGEPAKSRKLIVGIIRIRILGF